MAFTARLDKPCSHCGVTIVKGTNGGFTWDRLKGGFIHDACMTARKGGAMPGVVPGPDKCMFCGSERGPESNHVPGCPVGPVAAEPVAQKCTNCKLPAVYSTDHYKGCPFYPASTSIETAIEALKAVNPEPAAHVIYCAEKTCSVFSFDKAQIDAHFKDKHSEPIAEVKKNGNGKGPADELARLIQQLAGQRGIDEKEVRRIAADEANKVSNVRAIEIKVSEAPAVKLDLAHKDIPVLVKLVSAYGANGHRMNVYMHGPAGSGKSTAARQASDVLKLPYGYISLNPQTPDSRLLGYMHAGGEYVASEFFKRYTQGGVFCIDEIDNAAASLVTTLNGLLENGHGAFPHGVFERHADFVCVCTANTIGRGGDVNYPERRALDGAFLERFIFLQWGYDTALTEAIVTGVLGEASGPFLNFIKMEASKLQARYPPLIVSPRAFIQGAVLERNGLSRAQIVDMVIARGLQ